MSIVIRTMDGRYTPVAVCDACGEVIIKPELAAVVFDLAVDGEQRPRLAHKGRCHDLLDDALEAEGGSPGWTELGRWMADLIHNAGLQDHALALAIEDSRRIAELGL